MKRILWLAAIVGLMLASVGVMAQDGTMGAESLRQVNVSGR